MALNVIPEPCTQIQGFIQIWKYPCDRDALIIGISHGMAEICIRHRLESVYSTNFYQNFTSKITEYQDRVEEGVRNKIRDFYEVMIRNEDYPTLRGWLDYFYQNNHCEIINSIIVFFRVVVSSRLGIARDFPITNENAKEIIKIFSEEFRIAVKLFKPGFESEMYNPPFSGSFPSIFLLQVDYSTAGIHYLKHEGVQSGLAKFSESPFIVSQYELSYNLPTPSEGNISISSVINPRPPKGYDSVKSEVNANNLLQSDTNLESFQKKNEDGKEFVENFEHMCKSSDSCSSSTESYISIPNNDRDFRALERTINILSETIIKKDIADEWLKSKISKITSYSQRVSGIEGIKNITSNAKANSAVLCYRCLSCKTLKETSEFSLLCYESVHQCTICDICRKKSQYKCSNCNKLYSVNEKKLIAK